MINVRAYIENCHNNIFKPVSTKSFEWRWSLISIHLDEREPNFRSWTLELRSEKLKEYAPKNNKENLIQDNNNII